MFCGLLELFRFIVIDVRPLAFAEAIYEECFCSVAEKDDGPIAFRSSMPRSGDTLFDDFAAKASINLALFGTRDSVTQYGIRNSFLPGKALNHLD